MGIVHFIHGIHSTGRHSTDKLARAVESLGRTVHAHNYGKRLAIQAYSRKFQFKIGKMVYDWTSDGDDIVAHSFGGLATFRSTELGRKYNKIILIDPAMNSDFRFPRGCASEVIVVHNPMDKAIRLGGLLPNHDFGTLGSSGSTWEYIDLRIKNVCAPRSGNTHGFVFNDAELKYSAEMIINFIDNGVE